MDKRIGVPGTSIIRKQDHQPSCEVEGRPDLGMLSSKTHNAGRERISVLVHPSEVLGAILALCVESLRCRSQKHCQHRFLSPCDRGYAGGARRQARDGMEGKPQVFVTLFCHVVTRCITRTEPLSIPYRPREGLLSECFLRSDPPGNGCASRLAQLVK